MHITLLNVVLILFELAAILFIFRR